MAATTAMVVGGVGAGAGIMKGLQGTPDQVSKSSSFTKWADKTPEQLALEKQSQEQFNLGLKGISNQEQMLSQMQPNWQGSLDVTNQALSGGLFNLTPEEEARIAAQQQANVDYSAAQIGDMLNERLGGIWANTAQRGVRGQALSSLQVGANDIAAKRLQDAIYQNQIIAAQNRMQMPMQRAGMQLGAAQNAGSFMANLQQNALANRMNAQNPFLLQSAIAERQAASKQVGKQTQMGQPGDWADAFLGGLGGGAQGIKFATGANNAWTKLNAPTGMGG